MPLRPPKLLYFLFLLLLVALTVLALERTQRKPM